MCAVDAFGFSAHKGEGHFACLCARHLYPVCHALPGISCCRSMQSHSPGWQGMTDQSSPCSQGSRPCLSSAIPDEALSCAKLFVQTQTQITPNTVLPVHLEPHKHSTLPLIYKHSLNKVWPSLPHTYDHVSNHCLI